MLDSSAALRAASNLSKHPHRLPRCPLPVAVARFLAILTVSHSIYSNLASTIHIDISTLAVI